MSRLKITIAKDRLHHLYWIRLKSARQIGITYNCSETTIRHLIRDLGIPKRSPSSVRTRYKKFNFSGDLKEKAYLIGFRLGDLNVYQKGKSSELIVARCGTTHIVQVELIKKLFSKYGKITVSHGKYNINVHSLLNLSFDFLLPKYINVPKWIGNDLQTRAAFIAGYTDAEGNFILNQGRARFKIDSYDKEILSWIKESLEVCGIKVKLWRIAEKGNLRTDSLIFNNDLWRLNINEGNSLAKFISLIKPFVMHKVRRENMMSCYKNIERRSKNRTIKYTITH